MSCFAADHLVFDLVSKSERNKKMELSLNRCFGKNSLSVDRWLEELKQQFQKFQNASGFDHLTIWLYKPQKERRGRESTENRGEELVLRGKDGVGKVVTENLGRRRC